MVWSEADKEQLYYGQNNFVDEESHKKRGLIICRGGGDLATGIVHRLHRSGFHVLILETGNPAAIRRQVSFSEAVYDKTTTVEGVTAQLIGPVHALNGNGDRDKNALAKDAADARRIIGEGEIPILIDPEYKEAKKLEPAVLVDAIIAKKNLGTTIDMAPLVIGIGPGFTAGIDVDLVIESMRGHHLARIITDGSALADTGVPGNIGGYTKERVIHAQAAGVIENIRQIGDIVAQGDEIARIYTDDDRRAGAKAAQMDRTVTEDRGYVSVCATIPGIIRGLIRDGYQVTRGFKIADIDPREGELKNCFTISDKSRRYDACCLHSLSKLNKFIS